MPITSENQIPMIETGDEKAKDIVREFLEWLRQEEPSFTKNEKEMKIQTLRIIYIFKRMISNHGIKVDE